MGRFYSIGGMAPSGGEGRMGLRGDGRAAAARASAREDPLNAEFYAERERMAREEPDRFASGFGPGDRERFGDEAATVEHVEFDTTTGTERLWMRGDRSGTWISEWQKTSQDTAVLQRAKTTRD